MKRYLDLGHETDAESDEMISRSKQLDLEIVLRSGLLVQGSSGSGKSRTLRRIAEQAAGRVQIVIIDPEGEFASLREKHDFLLAAKTGGDVPIGINSAALLARRILELRTSTICDLYDLPILERHRWVRLFFESLMTAPKSQWHDVMFMIDEEHLFAPESGYGDSEATNAIIDFATRGRKRGFGHIGATQRLAALRKSVLAELKNALVGNTFYADDQERAAKTLGVVRRERDAFYRQLRGLSPGQFFALGRALSTERVLLKVGPVFTTHPEPGSNKHVLPPPTPAKIKRLIAELSDLPAEAEAEAKTVKELKAQVQALKTALAAKPVAPAAPPKTVQVEVVPPDLIKAIERLKGLAQNFDYVRDSLNSMAPALVDVYKARHTTFPSGSEMVRQVAVRSLLDAKAATLPLSSSSSKGKLGKGERLILTAIAQHNGGVTREQLTVLTGYKRSTRDAYLQRLGPYIQIIGDKIAATQDGIGVLGSDYVPLPTGDDLRQHWLGKLPEGERRILEVLVKAYPDSVERDAVSEQSSYKRSTRDAYLQRLSARRLVAVRGTTVCASADLFG